MLLTAAEDSEIQSAAKAAGVTPADFLRTVAIEVVHNSYERVRAVARVICNRALRRGELVPQPCVECGTGSTWGVKAHHDDYRKPLDVIWLCMRHHAKRHRDLGWGFGGSLSNRDATELSEFHLTDDDRRRASAHGLTIAAYLRMCSDVVGALEGGANLKTLRRIAAGSKE